MNDVEQLAASYLELKATIEALQKQQDEIKMLIKGEMGDKLTVPGERVEYPGVCVSVVKGRVTKTLDRKELVKLGVSGAVLDAGTKVTEFPPTLRISRVRADEAAA
jgi:hypothetical protein